MRKEFRKKNYAKPLGVACHYIADKYTLPSKYEKHDEFEDKIQAEPIREESFPKIRRQKETISTALEDPDLYRGFPFKIKMLPLKALNEAYRKCYQVAESVVSNTRPPTEFREKVRESFSRYRKKEG